MNTRIKIIKHNRNAEVENKSQPAENKTRDMVQTVKSWIVEFKDRRRLQPHSFSPLPVAALYKK
jgi:hypothetical protein